LKLKYFVLVLLAPAVMFASGDGEGKTDFVPRVINFAIFAGILYYLLAKPIKEFFVGRTNDIADKLTEIQDKLKKTKEDKEKALQKVKDADNIAEDIIETAKTEAKMLEEKIEQNLKTDLENLQKSYKDRIEVEEKKMTRNVVGEVVEDMFKGKKTELKDKDFLNIIKKKVA